MNNKTQRIVCGLLFCIAIILNLSSLFNAFSTYFKYDATLDIWIETIFSYVVPIIALIIAAIFSFAGKGKLFGAVGIAIAISYAFSFIQTLMKMGSYMNQSGDYSYLATYGTLTIFSSALFILAGILIFVSWQKGYEKNSMRTFAGAASIIGAILGIAAKYTSITMGGAQTAFVYIVVCMPSLLPPLLTGIGLFIASLAPKDAAQLQELSKTVTNISTPQAPSTTQLAELKQLLDTNVITQEEFDEQKQRFMQS
jgi:hypothetical protein